MAQESLDGLITHFYLGGLRGLEPTVLSGLDRINVVCGRNNSGKTTVLQALSDSKQRKIVIPFTDDQVDRFVESYVVPLQLPVPHSRNVAASFRGSLIAAVQAKGVWTTEDSSQFATTLHQELRRRHFDQPYQGDQLRELFDALAPPQPRVVLLPPKRRLDESANIQAISDATPAGSGILLKLFTAKNKGYANPLRVGYDRVAQAFASITDGHTFDIQSSDAGNYVHLFFRAPGQIPELPAADCGLGLQDVLVILYCAIVSDATIVLIEELENHLHPDMQRRLLRYLREETTRQYVIATHSNILLDPLLVDTVHFCRYDGKVHVDNITSRANMLADLGYSVVDNLVSDIVILVEGPKDIAALEELFDKMELYGHFVIKMWPLGGDIMSQVDLSVFKQSYRVLALIDRDDKSSKGRKNFVKNCEKYDIPLHKLKRYSLESYLSLDAIRDVMAERVKKYPRQLDPDSSVQEQLGNVSIKNNMRQIVRNMDIAEFHGTDLWKWLKGVEAALESRNGPV